ncbi:hypothetical protein OC834_001218 [Tilletia horrida]|nr:hypothetical protein OC834_001218 [Tilletia horrida]
MSASAAAVATSSSSSRAGGSVSSDREAFTSALRSGTRSPNNHYICHLKIQEQDPDPTKRAKTRYLIAAVDRETGRVTLNKARGNPNGTYSIGKDWDLNLLQELEVHTPSTFTITLTRPYAYTSTNASEQEPFLQMIVNVYRKYTGDAEGPHLINFVAQATSSRSSKSSRTAAPSNSSSSSAGQSQSTTQSSTPTSATSPDDIPSGRPSTSSVRSTTSSQNRSLRALDIPVPSITTSASSPTTPTAEKPSFASQFSSPGVSPAPSSKRRDKEREEPTLRKAASSITLSGSRNGRLPSPASAMPPAPLFSKTSAPLPGPGPESTDDDDDPYGGAVVTDHPSVQPSPVYAAPSSAKAAHLPAPPSRDSPTSAKSSYDPNGFPSQSSRTTNPSLKRMGSSPHMANGVSVPRRSESIPDLHRAANRRPGTAGSQGTTDGERSRSRGGAGGNAGEWDRAALKRSPSTPTGAHMDGSRYMGELPKVVLPVESPPPVPTPPSAVVVLPSPSEAPTSAQSQQQKSTLRPNPRAPGRVTRTLSTVLPLNGDEDDDDDEDTTLAYVEEMLEGFEWRPMIGDGMLGPGFGKRRRAAKTSDALFGGGAVSSAAASRGTADVIEARLLKELSALEEAIIHGMVESDERVGLVIKHMDDALVQLDLMEGMIMRFKMQLNGRDEDINHIESQNGALQIHTSNQQKLAAEIERLLDTIHVDEGSIYTLKHASLESRGGIEELERAAGELYKSIVQATSSTDEGVSAATERLDEYRALSERFCKRVFDHINLTLTAETASYLSDPARQSALGPSRHPGPSLQNHAHLEELLGRYCGLVLYMKETSPSYFSRLCAAYYASVSECWKREMLTFFAGWKRRIKRGSGDDYGWEVGDGTEPGSAGGKSGYESKISTEFGTFGRASTIRKVVKGEKSKTAKVQDDGDLTATEVFQRVVDSLTPLIQGEQSFLSDFLQINSSNVTFADYLDMEPYFRRRATQLFGFGTPTAAQGGGPMREMKSAMELIFGFLAPEWDALVDYSVHMDKSQITPILAMLDRAITDAEEVGSDYIVRSLTRAHTRLTTVLDKIEDEQAQQGGTGGGADGGASAAAAAQGKGASGEKKKKRVANLLRKHR